MAGAGYKLFVNGNALSASDLNTYVQQQTVMVFASASARTTALSGVLAEGMVSYRTDSHVFEVYNGTSWVGAGASSPLTTKGDLWGYNTADARVPVGTDGQLLQADSTNALGVSWTTVSSGGMTLLSTTTLSGASTTISSISGSYKTLYAIVSGVSATAGTFSCAVNASTTSAWNFSTSIPSGTYWYTQNADPILFSSNQSSNGYLYGSNNAWALTIANYTSTTARKPFTVFGGYGNGVGNTGYASIGLVNTTSAVTSLVFSDTGGSFSAGTVLLYGVN